MSWPKEYYKEDGWLDLDKCDDAMDRYRNSIGGMAWDYGMCLGLLDRYQFSADFCDDPACPECLCRFRHASTCQLARVLSWGAP